MVNISNELLERAKSLRWYHAIDFGEYQTVGRFKSTWPPNSTLYGVMDMLSHIDVRGMKCLDIGPAHGLISIGLLLKGAEYVAAINIGKGKAPQIAIQEEAFGVKLDYRDDTPIEFLNETFPNGTFDLIVCAGVMYHLLSPADTFFRTRRALKKNGLLVMESASAMKEKAPVLHVNTETNTIPETSTYFVPSPSASVGLAKLACFDVLATRSCAPSRFGLVGRAVDPGDVQYRSDLCKKIHERGITDPTFNMSELSQETSSIEYKGERDHVSVDVHKYVPDFPPHPRAITNPIGSGFTQHSQPEG